jgi:flagellar basal body-associated protein FliL
MSTAQAVPAIPALEVVEGAPPKKRGMLVLLIVGALVLGALGAGAWFLWPTVFGTAQAKAPVEPPVKATVALGPVVVNLNGEAKRYLRVGVSLGLPAPTDAKEIDEHKSQLLDLFISVFSSAEVETLTSDEGKASIKEDLLSRMREELHLKKVLRVYFTEFVIQ